MAIRRNPGDMPGRNWGSHTRGAAASAARDVASYYSDTARSVPGAVSQVTSFASRIAGNAVARTGSVGKQRRSLGRYGTHPRRTSSRVPRGRGASRR